MDKTTLKRCVDISARMGKILLQSGADITRVEDTVRHTMRSFGMADYDIYTVTNGIFLSASADGEDTYTRICDIPKNSSDLGKIDAVNTLSRNIEAGLCTLDEAEARLCDIERQKPKRLWIRLIAAGVVSGAFCALFGGGITDSLLSAFIGFSYYGLFVKLDGTKLSKILTNAICGCAMALLSILFVKLIPGLSMDKIIIGAIMPLIPGVSFANGVRDLAAGDYVSGGIRLVDAVMISFGIALGVGVTIALFTRLGVI